jgi:hypothetical protein
MKAVNIDWCLENDDYINLNEQNILPPTEVDIPYGVEEDEVVDYLSDEYGYLVNSFEIEY